LEADAAASDEDINEQEEQSQCISKALQSLSSSAPSHAAAAAFDPVGPKRQKICSNHDEKEECDEQKWEEGGTRTGFDVGWWWRL
jgi:hypothetical protein